MQIASEETTLKKVVHIVGREFSYLKAKWLTFMVITLAGVGVGFAYSYMQKPVYIAKLSFALEDDKSGGSGLSGALGIASNFGLNVGDGAGNIFSSANIIELMKSRKLVEQSLLDSVNIDGKATTLAEVYTQISGWRKKWETLPELNNLRFLPGTPREKFSQKQDSVLGIIYRKLSESGINVNQKDRKVSIIDIEISSVYETFSKLLAETFIKEVSEFYVETKSKKAKTNLAILERQTDSIRTELNNAITGVAVANDNIYNLNPAFNVRRIPSTKRQVDIQVNNAILTELVKNLELAKITVRKETPLIQVIDTPILPLDVKKTGRLKSLVVGGLLFFFASFLYFSGRRYVKTMLV